MAVLGSVLFKKIYISTLKLQMYYYTGTYCNAKEINRKEISRNMDIK